MRPGAQRGIGLVETLVGIVVGLLVTLVIYQLFAGFEAQRRVTVSSAGAQQSGAVALSVLARAIAIAGWGSVSAAAPNCASVRTWDSNPGAPLAVGVSMQPVVILDGGGGLSDTLIVSRGGATRAAAPLALRKTMAGPGEALSVMTTTGLSPGDHVWVTDGSQCTLMAISTVDQAQGTLGHDPGPAWPYNPSAAQLAGWPAYPAGARIYSLGTLVSQRFGVTGGDLVVNDVARTLSGLVDNVVAAHVVNLQAQYGISADLAPQAPINQWVDGGAVAGLHPGRIKAVRLALVTRGDEARRPDAGGTCAPPVLPLPWPGASPFDLSGAPDWACYRYQVHQTIVPLRNVLLSL